MPQKGRSAKRAISIHSHDPNARLTQLLRSGKSQLAIIADALDRMPLRLENDRAARHARIDAILAQIHNLSGVTMAAFDAETFEKNGLPN